MGNSHGGHQRHKGDGGSPLPATSSSSSLHPQQSLPRDGIRGQLLLPQLPPSAHKPYNGGFKVLPERVPGQKLRLTDNGNVLHNGGTLSGRRVGGDQMEQQREIDPPFMRVLRHRSDSVQDITRLDEEDEDDDGDDDDNDDDRRRHRIAVSRTNRLAKKYHSNPDLLNCPRSIDANPSASGGGGGYLDSLHDVPPDRPSSGGKDGKKKKLLRKTKAAAPPLPPHQQLPPYGNGGGGGGGGRRGFASFLKPSSSSSGHKKSSSGGGSPCHHHDDSQSLPIVPNVPAACINAEVVAAKLDSRDKSVTYVLERRPVTQCSNGSVLSAASVPSKYSAGNNNVVNRNADDASFLRRGGGGNSAEYRVTPLNDLEKRVQSVDSIAAIDHAYYQSHQGRFYPQEGFNKSLDSLRGCGTATTTMMTPPPPISSDPLATTAPTANISLGRRLSNRSNSQLSGAGGGADQVRTIRYDHHMQARPDPRSRSDNHHHPQQSYFYGGAGRTASAHVRSDHGEAAISGSLDRRHGGGSAAAAANFQRISAPVQRSGDSPSIQESAMNPCAQDRAHGVAEMMTIPHWNRNLDNFSKDKLRPMNSKEIITPSKMTTTAAVAAPQTVEKSTFLRRPSPPISDDGAGGAHSRVRSSSRDHLDLSSEDEMDINMQLRPTLPKRLPTLPRFSPTQVWRSFSLEDVAAPDVIVGHQRHNSAEDRCSDSEDEEEGDVFEDRIHRIAKPVAPPRSNNEKSGDSGISPGANSPTPVLYDFNAVLIPEKLGSGSDSLHVRHQSLSPVAAALLRQKHSSLLPLPISPSKGICTAETSASASAVHERPITISTDERIKPSAWTPEEDLQSDFDAGSADHQHQQQQQRRSWNAAHMIDGPDIVATQPKLTTRKEMFFLRSRSSEQLDAVDALLPESPDPRSVTAVGKSMPPLSTTTTTQNDGRKSGGGGGGDEYPAPSSAAASPQKYNSVRKLKRSLSGALQAGHVRLRSLTETPTSLDENWSLSRSLPNSLHSGVEGDRRTTTTDDKMAGTTVDASAAAGGGGGGGKHVPQMQRRQLPRSESGPVYPMSVMQERRPFADLEGRAFADHKRGGGDGDIDGADGPPSYNRNGRIVYLPKYEAIEIVPNGGTAQDYRRRTYSDLGTGSKAAAASAEYRHSAGVSYVAVGGGNNNNNQATNVANGHGRPRRPKKFTYQSTVRQIERKQLEQKLSEVVAVKEKQRNREMELVNKVEEEFQRKRDREKANIRHQLRILSLDEDDAERYNNRRCDVQTSNARCNYDAYDEDDVDEEDGEDEYGENDYNGRQHHNGYISGSYVNVAADKVQSSSSTGLFSGIGKWMKRQQRLGSSKTNVSVNDHSPLRQAPEGASAPSSPGNQIDGDTDNGNSVGCLIPPPVPPQSQQTRNQVVVGAKFSSGRTPPTGARTMLTGGAAPAIRRPEESHANRIWIT